MSKKIIIDIENIKNFTPKKINNQYGIMLIEFSKCPLCKKTMVMPPSNDYKWNKLPFPNWIEIEFDAQIKKAGWVKQHPKEIADQTICEKCAKEGKVTFKCAICKEEKSISKIQEEIGSLSPDYFCK